MREMKAAVIGAGSSYTPELIEGFIDRKESLNFTAFYLMDIDREKLSVVGGLAERMLRSKGFEGEIVLTGDLDEALTGADYVFGQIRVGKMEARIRDEKIPLKYGLLGQETTGAGGFMNALRTVPALLHIAKRMEVLAPDAWLVNFSNPSGIVAQALLNHTKAKTIGLCNCPINMLKDVEKILGTDDFTYDYVGLNHLSFITSVLHEGREVLDEVRKGKISKMQNIPDFSYDPALMRAIPYIPTSYMSYFYLRDEQVQKCLKAEKTRGEICVELETSLMEQYKNPNLDIKPAELASRGGALYSTAAVSAVDAIENDKNEYHVVNVKNDGTLPYLDDDDVVEVKCLLNRQGAVPVRVVNAGNDYVSGIIRSVKAYERLTVKAAVTGSREDALAALMVHPLIGDFKRAKGALDEMLEANREFVPNFFR